MTPFSETGMNDDDMEGLGGKKGSFILFCFDVKQYTQGRLLQHKAKNDPRKKYTHQEAKKMGKKRKECEEEKILMR